MINIRNFNILNKLHDQEKQFKRELSKTFLEYLDSLSPNKRLEQMESLLYDIKHISRLPTLDRRLTLQEKKCFYLVSIGKEIKEMARILGIFQRTIEFHRANIVKKLEVPNLMAAVALKNQSHATDNNGFLQKFWKKNRIIKDLPNYIFVKDLDLIYKLCNQNFVEAIGGNPIGKSDYALPWDKSSAALYQEEDRYIISTGKTILNKEVPMILLHEEKCLSISKVPFYDDNEKIVGILGIYFDITVRKQSEIAKQKFLINMAHDFKKTLELLTMQVKKKSCSNQQDLLRLVYKANGKLSELINSMTNSN